MNDIIVTIQGRDFKVPFPTVGKIIDIRTRVNSILRGQGRDLLMGVGLDIDAYLYAQTIAHIVVLVPEVLKEMKVNSLLDLSLVDFQELVEVYEQKIFPWLTESYNSLKKPVTDENQPDQPLA